jgi:thiol-disulfide isomerase/thioredoxin
MLVANGFVTENFVPGCAIFQTPIHGGIGMKTSSSSRVDGTSSLDSEPGLRLIQLTQYRNWPVTNPSNVSLRQTVIPFWLGPLFVLLVGCWTTDPSLAQNRATEAQLYFFTNPGCAPCRQVEPEIESLRRAGYDVTTVFLDRSPEWGQKFSVDRTPTVIMVANQKVVGRHAGLIDAKTLKLWFTAVGADPQVNREKAVTGVDASTRAAEQMETYSEAPDAARFKRSRAAEQFNDSPTLHAGTNTPSNQAERLAMNATVRLKVQDAGGASYATGTVIHSHDGEWLVMTCGHAFREAGSRGKITAEYGFLSGSIQVAVGQLISYDAESRDVALVAIHTGNDIEPVKLATVETSIDRGLNVFTIGCDGGSDPTIRHTQIKNKAVYAPVEQGNRQPQGAIKYEIWGRPAIGRSGGGMFNQAGELIGVCNAAAVETDEGIYSALDSLYWQIARSNLSHLFGNDLGELVATNNAESHRSDTLAPAVLQDRFASLESNPANISERLDSQDTDDQMQPVGAKSLGFRSKTSEERATRLEADSDNSDTEVIIIVRSKSAPQLGESITISNPTPQLIQYLGEMRAGSEDRKVDLARVRQGQ